MKAWDVVGYTYQAEEFTPSEMVEALIADRSLSPGARGMTAEDALDQLASVEDVDRYDERTFDSWDFPKVIFAADATEELIDKV